MAQALVLEKKGELSLRDISLNTDLTDNDVRIAIHTVGICGSDVHYYTHGKIGPFIVDAPMVLGHEASGVIVEVGGNVSHLKVGDRVCMEPGIPDPNSRASKLGIYNVDPSVKFWATPPIHGCLTPEVVHPASYTYKIADTVSFAEGAMVEPFAIGMQAVLRAGVKAGDVGVVLGAGPIGMMTALAAVAGGCARVFVADFAKPKLEIINQYEGIEIIDLNETSAIDVISNATDGWGADVVFECSGAAPAILNLPELACPGGCVTLVGMPIEPVPFDIVGMQAKELRIETVFRYANIYERAIELIASGKIDLKPLISDTFSFSNSIEAFERAASGLDDDVKLQITLKN